MLGSRDRWPAANRKHIDWWLAKRVYRPWWDGYFKFAFVRHPYDQLASHYLYHAANHDVPSGLDFAGYLDRAIELGRWSFILRMQQSVRQAEALGTALDFVGRFERFTADFARLREHLDAPGLELPPRDQSLLPNHQKTARMDLRSLYDKRLQRRVAEFWRCDFEAFGYSTELGR